MVLDDESPVRTRAKGKEDTPKVVLTVVLALVAVAAGGYWVSSAVHRAISRAPGEV
jgi:multidrug resistance efflux pump